MFRWSISQVYPFLYTKSCARVLLQNWLDIIWIRDVFERAPICSNIGQGLWDSSRPPTINKSWKDISHSDVFIVLYNCIKGNYVGILNEKDKGNTWLNFVASLNKFGGFCRDWDWDNWIWLAATSANASTHLFHLFCILIFLICYSFVAILVFFVCICFYSESWLDHAQKHWGEPNLKSPTSSSILISIMESERALGTKSCHCDHEERAC